MGGRQFGKKFGWRVPSILYFCLTYYTRAHKHEMNVNTVLYTQSSPGDFNCCDNNFFFPSRAVAHKSARGFLSLPGVGILCPAEPSCQMP